LDDNFDRPSGTGALYRYPGTSCLYVFSALGAELRGRERR
jgi:hypothetical protein